LRSFDDAWPELHFQGEAVRATRERIPTDRSLIGFVGGPWTLFVYAVEGTHKGALTDSKKLLPLFPRFCRRLVPLLERNIELQLDNGAEMVMIFDTAAGELSPAIFLSEVAPQLEKLTRANAARIGYYSKGTQAAHLQHELFLGETLAGLGFDHRWNLSELFPAFPRGFIQGNFDQALLLSEPAQLQARLRYLAPVSNSAAPAGVSAWAMVSFRARPRTTSGCLSIRSER
jgi:uroporphyrinogen decarboxylase